MLYDKDIREPLFDFLDGLYPKNRILEEKDMGRSRADVVMVTAEAVYGIEIKSDADSYARLKSQIRDYDQYYDCNYVVVGTTHANHITEHVPKWWGIITVELEDAHPDFYVLRKPEKNPKMDWKKKMSMIWRPELAHIQELNHMPKYKEKSKKFVIDKILEKVPEETLQIQVCEELLQRDYTEIEDIIREFKRK
ncbi:MAG: sce7726 family protein [Lachnospiraceae bacterium]|nr:sce7726 family protein [Lachnospiraceae bacterium]